jgi:hypothetical protein
LGRHEAQVGGKWNLPEPAIEAVIVSSQGLEAVVLFGLNVGDLVERSQKLLATGPRSPFAKVLAPGKLFGQGRRNQLFDGNLFGAGEFFGLLEDVVGE